MNSLHTKLLATIGFCCILALAIAVGITSHQNGEIVAYATGSFQLSSSSEVFSFNNDGVSTVPDGGSQLFTNDTGFPILITDIQAQCNPGTCENVGVFEDTVGNPSNKYHVRFDVVTKEPKFYSFATGFVLPPDSALGLYKTGGGALRINLSGVLLPN